MSFIGICDSVKTRGPVASARSHAQLRLLRPRPGSSRPRLSSYDMAEQGEKERVEGEGEKRGGGSVDDGAQDAM